MTAQRVKLKRIIKSRDKTTIENYCKMILDGAVFIYPTDTIYGIGGVVSEEIGKRIFDIKNRSQKMPLLWVTSELDIIKKNGVIFGDKALSVANKFWPNNLTLILNTPSDKTVGVRVSSHPFLQMVSEFIKKPIFSTSANISGEKYNGNPDNIYDTFKNDIDLFFDYGFLPQSESSTIIDLTDEVTPKLIREGSIKKDELTSFLGILFTE